MIKKLTAIATLSYGLLAPAVAFADDRSWERPAEPGEVAAIRPRVPVEEPPPVNLPSHGGGGEGNAAGEGHEGDPTKTFNFFSLHYGKDQYGGKFGDGYQVRPDGEREPSEEPMSAPFAFALINFGILLVILGKYGGPVARKMAETRSDEIKRALDEAARLRQAAAAKLDEYSTRLKAAESEMATMLTNMRADAENEKARILAHAEEQAAATKREADIRIAAEIERARSELAREVAVAAAGVAEKLLREKTTPVDQTAMVDTFIRDVESAARGRAGVA